MIQSHLTPKWRPVRPLVVFLCFFLFSSSGTSQEAGISGRVLERETRQPLGYTNIVLFSADDSTQVAGTVTDGKGEFVLKNPSPGHYYLDVLFLGYERQRFELEIGQNPVAMGDILLSPTAVLLGDVVVEGERPSLTYEIDKKVIDVSQLPSTISGNAAEVLENVPSVQVDIEGNVSLRGSGNFTVLIDGRPTILDAQEVLQQIPASAIGRIEIITNPSAKYDPEGTAGVINIIMARRRERGLSGLLTGNVGLREKYGGDALFEYRVPGLNIIAGGDHNNRIFFGREREENSYAFQNSTNFTQTVGDARWGRYSWSLRGGAEYMPSELDLVRFGLRHGRRSFERRSTLDHEEWSLASPQRIVNTNTIHRHRGGQFTSIDVGYLRTFGGAGHELKADLQFGFDRSDEYTISELYDGPGILEGRRTTEEGPETEFEGKVEYVLPFGENRRFEAGYQGESESSGEKTGLHEYDSVSGGYQSLTQFAHDVKYVTNEHAVYSLYAGEIGPLGFQGGLRGEYTQRKIRVQNTGEEFGIDRWDFFPTAHISYSFGGVHQILASYTRRINRPRGWELEPFDTWMDANNVRRGNPGLSPEYIDSYEIGAQTALGGVSLSAELYRTVTHHRIEDIRSVYSSNVTLRMPANVGRDYSLGTEILVNFDLMKGWNVNVIGNLYRFEIDGEVLGESFSRSSTNWSTRLNSSLKWGTTQFQVNTRIQSPTVSSQGRREGFVSLDLAIRQELFNKQLTLIAQARDVFGTERREFSSRGTGFSTHQLFDRESPVVMLTVRYTLGGFKAEEHERSGEEGGEGGRDEF